MRVEPSLRFVARADPPRLLTSSSATLLAGIGVFFLRVLVADRGDNAYLWLALIGLWLFVVAAPFAVSTLLPHGRLRLVAVLLGVALASTSGAICGLALVQALVVIPSQNYPTNQVFVSHLLGLITILPALIVVVLANLAIRQKTVQRPRLG